MNQPRVDPAVRPEAVAPVAPAAVYGPAAHEVLDGVGEMLQHRNDHHMTIQTGVTDRRDQAQPGLRCRRPRLDITVQLRVPHRQRDRHGRRDLPRHFGDQRQVSPEQRPLVGSTAAYRIRRAR